MQEFVKIFGGGAIFTIRYCISSTKEGVPNLISRTRCFGGGCMYFLKLKNSFRENIYQKKDVYFKYSANDNGLANTGLTVRKSILKLYIKK